MANIKENTVIRIALPPPGRQDTQARQEAARLWNRCVRLHRWFRKRNKPWPSRFQFMAHYKGRFALHSQTVQAIIERFFSNIDTARTNRRNGLANARYPYRFKKYVPVIWKESAIKIQDGRIFLSMGQGRPPLIYRLPKLPEGKVVRAELGYRELRLTLQRELPEVPRKAGIAAADLGIIHLATVTDGNQSLAVVGRGLRSIIQWYNKKLAAIRSLLSKCRKGSRRWRKLKRRLRQVARKRDNLQRNLLHHAANAVVDYCRRREVGTLVVGKVTDLNRNKRKKRSLRLNQEVGHTPLGQLVRYLDYKLKRIGCALEFQSEAYTTQTCPACGQKHKPVGRRYLCRCGFQGVRDEVGAINLLNRFVHGEIRAGAMRPTGNVKYLRPVKLRSGVAPMTPGKWLGKTHAAGSIRQDESLWPVSPAA